MRRKSPVSTVATEPQYCSIDLRLKILGRLTFFAGLSQKALEKINQRFIEVGYQPGDRIYSTGEAAERLFVVAEGKIKLFQDAPNGRSVLLDILTSGEFFGNLASLGTAEYADTAQAQTQSCVLSIQLDNFNQILEEHPGLALKVLSVMTERLNSAHQRLLQLSTLPVENRIASTLLKLGEKLGRVKDGRLLIDVPLSRNELAEMTGATPETVSRVMSQLQSDRIIESGRQWVAIRDRTRLEAVSRAGQ